MRPLADNFLSGINSTVFAYGITGAGKSFTMFGKAGEEGLPGLIELVFEYLCGEVGQQDNVRLALSYMEIYNEQVFDLLKQKSENLQIQDDPVLGVVVSDLEEVEVQNARQAQNYIEQGNQRRVIAETKANEFSSRSHAIVQISMERSLGESVLTAKLSLVDLAGSERQNVYNENKGIRNIEGSNINRSLLTLGNCINMLSDKRRGAFIPYRDSKLTRLLKESLGGNTKTAMVACISPSVITYDETLNTMKYACRARKIEKSVHQNVKEPRNLEEMKREVCKLRKEIELLRCDDDRALPKDEMQELLQKLIRNVEALTVLRCAHSSELADKIKEIDLIEQQKDIVSSLLGRSQEDKAPPRPPAERGLVRSNTTDLDLSALRQKKAKTLTNKQMNFFKNMAEEERSDKCRQHRRKQKEGRENEEDELVPPARQPELARNNSFVRSNLENIRLKYKQNRKNLKDLIVSYHENYTDPDARAQLVQQAHLYLANIDAHRTYLNVADLKTLHKIREGQPLDLQEVEHYSLDEAVQRQETEVESFSSLNGHRGAARHDGSNRFTSSLEEIRRMMRKISSIGQPEQAELEVIEQQDYEQTEEYPADLFYEY